MMAMLRAFTSNILLLYIECELIVCNNIHIACIQQHAFETILVATSEHLLCKHLLRKPKLCWAAAILPLLHYFLVHT